MLLGAIETVGIVEELMEIWPHEVCDSGVFYRFREIQKKYMKN